MGDAKRREASKTILTDDIRAKMLGVDPFGVAIDLIYGMAEAVYTKTGAINHQLIGLEFEAGKPTGVHVLLVKRVEDVPALQEKMLQHWPLVAHVFEAWLAPPGSEAPPHAHPLRQDVVVISLNSPEVAMFCNCPVNGAKRTINRGEFIVPTAIGGRLGRHIGPRPLSS